MGKRRTSDSFRIQGAYSLATTSVALVLFVLGLIGYLAVVVETSVQRIVKGMSVTVILNDKVRESALPEIELKLRAIPNVKEVIYTSKEQAADEFKKFTGEDFTAFLDNNPLPASYDLVFDAGTGAAVSTEVEAAIKAIAGVDEILYQRDVVSKVLSMVNKIRFVLIGLVLTLLVISMVLINNSINMILFSRKKLLRTMKLVGATNGFIQRPFVWKAFWQGVKASFVASFLLSLVIYFAGEFSREIGFVSLGIEIMCGLYGALFFIGIGLCMCCTILSVRKYVNISNPEVYIY